MLENLSLFFIMTIFTYEIGIILTIILTLLSIAFTIALEKIKQGIIRYKKENKDIIQNFPVAFYLCVSNIIVMIVMNFCTCGWYQ